MRISILERMPNPRTPLANVASEVASEGGYIFSTFQNPSLLLYLGFKGALRELDVTFINPYADSKKDKGELLPASKERVGISLSAEAKTFGAHALLEFSGLSPRIRVTFTTKPSIPSTVGSAVIGFTGVWPMTGKYSCLDVNNYFLALTTALEPYGSVMLSETAQRKLRDVVNAAILQNTCRIEAVDGQSAEYVKDSLVDNLFDLMFDRVGTHSAALKAQPITLPNTLNNTVESTQDSIFTRTVVLAL